MDFGTIRKRISSDYYTCLSTFQVTCTLVFFWLRSWLFFFQQSLFSSFFFSAFICKVYFVLHNCCCLAESLFLFFLWVYMQVDIFLICDNAMIFNAKGTVYYRHVSSYPSVLEIFGTFQVSFVLMKFNFFSFINIRHILCLTEVMPFWLLYRLVLYEMQLKRFLKIQKNQDSWEKWWK